MLDPVFISIQILRVKELPVSIEKVIEDWDGELSCCRFDRDTGAFFTVAIHSRRLGPAAGGTRAMNYAGFDAAVEDATRLASAMTLKMIMADLPMGGGKSTIALPKARRDISADHWDQILKVHAEMLKSLGGNYWTGPDVGTSSEDMDSLHASSGYAFGRSVGAGGPGSSAPETAHGVYVSMIEAIHDAGISDLRGRRVVIQGLGAVGYDVAQRAAMDGAHVVAADPNEAQCKRAADELGVEVIPTDQVLSQTSDVFVPCATGGIVDDSVARSIRTKAIAGAANNVLASESAGDELARRGIVYAPDFVANGGGAIHLVGREVLGWSAEMVSRHVLEIGHTLEQIFARARAEGVGAERAARRIAAERVR